MDIDYNIIMTYSSEKIEDYINNNRFTDNQKLEIYSFYNRNRKDKISVKMQKERGSDIKQGITYASAFLDNIEKLGKSMSGAEFLIMVRLCKLMQHGNMIANISQSALAEELGMSKSNVCKCWKKLIEKNILIIEGKHTLINANLFLKGQYKTLNTTRKEYVKKSLRTDFNGQKDVFINVFKDSIFEEHKEEQKNTTDSVDNIQYSDLSLLPPLDEIDWDEEDCDFYDSPVDENGSTEEII